MTIETVVIINKVWFTGSRTLEYETTFEAKMGFWGGNFSSALQNPGSETVILNNTRFSSTTSKLSILLILGNMFVRSLHLIP